jgi:hypothetical protein
MEPLFLARVPEKTTDPPEKGINVRTLTGRWHADHCVRPIAARREKEIYKHEDSIRAAPY